MKTLNFKLLCLGCAVVLGLAISNGVVYADTIFIGTGTAATTAQHPNGSNTGDMFGNPTDRNKDGYLDSAFASIDSTMKRDVNWHVTRTDLTKNSYVDYLNGNTAAVDKGRAKIEATLKNFGTQKPQFTNPYRNYGNDVYGASADILGNTAMQNGGMSNFAVNNKGVITLYNPMNREDAADGNYKYGANNNISHSRTDEGVVQTSRGIFAFTTSFTHDKNEGLYNFINGSFSVMGELLGIYINGNLVDPSLYYLSDDKITTGYEYASEYEMEINLNEAGIGAMLNKDGKDNNITFMVLGIPHEFTGTYAESNLDEYMSFVYLSADLSQNTNSINDNNSGGTDDSGGETPEPATLLIVGMGLVGLGIRRKLTRKDLA